MSRQRDDGGETVDLRDPRHAEERRARIGLLSAGFSGEPPLTRAMWGVYSTTLRNTAHFDKTLLLRQNTF